MKPLPAIRKLGHTVDRFNQGCAAFRRAMQAWNNKDVAKYESGLLSAARDAPDALEWALKIYLGRLEMAPEDRAKLREPSFSQLMELMKKYAQPPVDRETINCLYDYREMRNDCTHKGVVPSPTEVANAITHIRQVMLTYLPLEAEHLSEIGDSPEENKDDTEPPPRVEQNTVFISYSSKDDGEKERLLSHLGVIKKVGLIDLVWSEDLIQAGADWRAEINHAMTQAKVAILLVSANFLTSDFILNQEIPALLQRHQQEGLTIFPVIAKACAWHVVPWLAAMQIRPQDGQPVWGRSDSQIDAALADLATEVARLFQPNPPTATLGTPFDVTPSLSVAPSSPPNNIIIGGNVGPGAAIGPGARVEAGQIAGGDIVTIIHHHSPPSPKVTETPPLPFEPETILIPTGPFVMGSDEGETAYEKPAHTVILPAYRIGRYPVTNRQYAEFIRQTNLVVEPALMWQGNLPPEDKLDHPVAGVIWFEALAYCQWLSEQTGRKYSLPSEAQWEKAARGTDGRIYPWGQTWLAGRCNPTESLVAVTTYPAQNDYGGYDLVGNAREWTSTVWGNNRAAPDPAYAYPWRNDGRDDLTAPGHLRRVYRGGPADNVADFNVTDLRCSRRGGFLPDQPGPRGQRHGFRVVLLSSLA